MIKKLYQKYFQKSKSFLFPLLSLSKRVEFKPLDTYLSWQGYYDITDRKLIVVYNNPKLNLSWQQYLKNTLLPHKLLLEFSFSRDREYVILVFDLGIWSESIDWFLAGKYSKLSQHHKTSILNYHGLKTPEWAYLQTFLFPEKYYSDYARMFDIDEDILRRNEELAERYDPKKENLIMEKEQVIISKESI